MSDLRQTYAEQAAAQPLADKPAAEHRRGPRGLVNLAIAAFLVLQVAIPLHYYLRDPSDDERFSWRMFSSLRERDCRVQVTEFARDASRAQARSREVTVTRDVHIAWLHLLQRKRAAVIEAYLRRRCAQPDVIRARFMARCQAADGSQLPLFAHELDCSTAETAP